MIIPVDKNLMRSISGNEIIAKACSDLSALGVDNFIYWDDVITVNIGDVQHFPLVDYVEGGVRFLKP